MTPSPIERQFQPAHTMAWDNGVGPAMSNASSVQPERAATCRCSVRYPGAEVIRPVTSCAYFERGDMTLEETQIAKIDVALRRPITAVAVLLGRSQHQRRQAPGSYSTHTVSPPWSTWAG
jgi:hypothetical protein